MDDDLNVNTLFITFDGSLLKRDREKLMRILINQCRCTVEDPKIHKWTKIKTIPTEDHENTCMYSLVLKTPVKKCCDIIYGLIIEKYFETEKRTVKYQINNMHELIENAEDAEPSTPDVKTICA